LTAPSCPFTIVSADHPDHGSEIERQEIEAPVIFSLATFTLIHVAISLAGIGSGLVVAIGLLSAKRLDGWTAIFLATTVLTSVTGYGFPFEHLLPSHIVGGISLLVLAVAIYARYGRHLTGPWRRVYVIGAVVALYLNVFVLVVQLFRNVPALTKLAPTQSEPPFAIAQLVVLALFVGIGVAAASRFRDYGSGFDAAKIS
jgi:hypothetical protein